MVEASRKRRFAATSVRASSVFGSIDAHAPLLDAIAANPDDAAAWAVYADLLQTEDHPRGELISLMMERERQPSSRLLAAQRRQLGVHEATLLPPLGRDVAIAWRRGFVSELRLVAPEQLVAVVRDQSLRFVEAATLVIDEGSWTEWRDALKGVRLPWRRLRLELADAEPLDLAAMTAPALETLRIAWPADATGAWISGDGAQLKLLVLVNAGEVSSLDDADLPRLEELRLLGDSVATDELRNSLCWNRLKRVVLADAGDVDDEADIGPIVHAIAPLTRIGDAPDDDDEEQYDDDGEPVQDTEATTAFVVVGRAIEPALLRKLAARMSIAHLSARVCPVGWLPRPLTVIQLFGTAEADLLPYGLAIALQNVLDGTPPIALVEVEEDRAARYLVLCDTQVRGTHARPDHATRRALDLALGYDPGSSILEDLLDELASAPIECLLGDRGTQQLVMIDPSAAPLVEPETEDDYDDEEEEDEDEYEDWDDPELQCDHEPELQADDPDEDPGLARPRERRVVVTDVPVAELVIAAVEVTPADDELPIVVEDEVDSLAVYEDEEEDALVAAPEREEQWLEFRENWEDRAIDVDEEPGEIRWPDPQHVWNEPELIDRQVAEPSCARHVRALDGCRSCGVLHCVECGGEDWCSTCVGRDALEGLVQPAALPRERLQ